MLAIELGLTPDAFWRSTPREISLHVRAHARRAKARTRRDLAFAWHVAAFQRVERLAPLKEILRPPRERAPEEDLDRRGREHEAIVVQMRRAAR